MILVSACLLGLSCRYDAKEKADRSVLDYLKDKNYLPICPEQMGGLPTPRDPAEIVSLAPLKICTEEGADVTEAFVNGVKEVEKLLDLFQVEGAILKAKSPSCGSRQVYDGNFTRRLIKGQGILASMLRDKKINVMNEEDLA